MKYFTRIEKKCLSCDILQKPLLVYLLDRFVPNSSFAIKLPKQKNKNKLFLKEQKKGSFPHCSFLFDVSEQ